VDLQRRVDELNNSLQGATGDNQRLLAELARYKASFSELETKFDVIARENKQLSGRLQLVQFSYFFIALQSILI